MNTNLKKPFNKKLSAYFLKGDYRFFNSSKSYSTIFIETIVLFAIWSIFLSVLFFFASCFFDVGKCIDFKTIFGGGVALFIAFFWGRTNRYGSQWLYCANVFNKIFYELKQYSPVDDGEYDVYLDLILYRRLLLAIDLLDCDLWDHPSFKNEFFNSLEIAIDYKNKSEDHNISPKSESWYPINSIKNNQTKSLQSI